jgi:hypothetical protein
VSFKAKLAGASNSKGKQYPVGTFEICLGGTAAAPTLAFKQSVQGVNDYNGYKLASTLTSLGDFGFDDNGSNGSNSSAIVNLQCDPAVDVAKCKASSVSISGWTAALTARDDGAAAPTAADVASLVKGLCTPLATIPKGVPKTARSATIAILAGGSTTGYAPTYFTAAKKATCPA